MPLGDLLNLHEKQEELLKSSFRLINKLQTRIWQLVNENEKLNQELLKELNKNIPTNQLISENKTAVERYQNSIVEAMMNKSK